MSEVKRGVLQKLSIVRGKSFRKENYKQRLFELSSETLHYFDGDTKSKGKKKGSINVSSIKVVKPVDDHCLESKDNVFQVVFQDGKNEFSTLYVVATSSTERQQWIDAIRECAAEQGAQFHAKFHPGVWTKKNPYYNCCDQSDRNAIGCKPTDEWRHVTSPPMPPPRPLEQTTPTKAVVAMYPFTPSDYRGLDLIQGEKYTILDDSAEHWWKVEDCHGKTGYIPSNYVKPNIGLDVFEWYYKNCSRKESERILKKSPKEGTFLVRDSETNPGEYCLAVYTNEEKGGNVRQYRINHQDDTFFISPQHCEDSIQKLIYYHKHNPGGIYTRLREPPNRGNKPSTAGVFFERWHLDPKKLRKMDELGHGNFGVVFRGEYCEGSTKIPVAIKEIPKNPRSSEVEEEVKTMTQLKHQNLVQLYGVIFMDNKQQMIITELLEHGALDKFLKKRKPELVDNQNMLLEFALMVCRGMEYLDTKQFIHRDLAARNCLVSRDLVVKVCDFGMSRMVLEDDQYQMSPGSKFPVKWAAPEVLYNHNFSSKSDVWAYGILLWEIYSFGEMPYSGIKNYEVPKFVVEDKGRLEQPTHAPMPLYLLMKQCWDEVPTKRPNFSTIKIKLESLFSRSDYVPT